jgi:hypothetical protein
VKAFAWQAQGRTFDSQHHPEKRKEKKSTNE